MSGATSLRDVLGPVAELLDDPKVVEISCNPSGHIFVERFGSAPVLWGKLDPAVADRFVRWCASWSSGRITADTPIFSGRIHGTPHRIEAPVPPVVDAPSFSIRRHSERLITLRDYVPEDDARTLISEAIAQKKNILIAGGTSSGKTTLLNACLLEMAAMAPETRLITIKDTPEIRSPFENSVAMRTTDTIGMDRLLVSALRQAPDRIVVGEVREGAVLMTLIKSWNTGHPGGLVTLHANSAHEVMPRLQVLASEVLINDPVPILMQAMDMIVFIQRGTEAPVVKTIETAVRDPLNGSKMERVYVNG